jgi:hypothetical protein
MQLRELSNTLKGGLKGILDQRVTFDPIERRLYSHDIGVFPKLVRPLVGNTMLAAVVQPHSEDEF